MTIVCEKRTAQEAFDLVWKRLHEQGHPSVRPENQQCMYVAENGDRCAAGWLLPEEATQPHRNSTAKDMEEVGEIKWNTNLDLLERMQKAHDGVWAGFEGTHCRPGTMEQWENAMRAIAKEFNLTVPA